MNRIFNAEWLSDGRNAAVLLLLVVLVVMSFALALGTYSITHGPSPYEMAAHADAAHAELRTRMNVDNANQQTVNANVTNQLADINDQLDQINDQIDTLRRAEGLPARKHHHIMRKH